MIKTHSAVQHTWLYVALQHIHATMCMYSTTLGNWRYLTTNHGNSWDCPVLFSLSQLLRTLCLISSVTPDLHCWETASGGRQARKRATTMTRLSIVTLDSFSLYLYSTENRALDCQSDRTAIVVVPSLIHAISWSWDLSEIWLVEVTHTHGYLWEILANLLLQLWHFD